MDIRQYMETWAACSYGQGIDCCIGFSDSEKSQAKTILLEQKLFDKKMDGNSAMNIPYIYDKGLKDVSLSQCFSNAVGNTDYVPVVYIMNIIRSSNSAKRQSSEIRGIVGRGLRTLPSFIREMDLEYKLRQLQDSKCVRTSAKNDIYEHTDVVLYYKNGTYRIWSYMLSNRSLFHAPHKLRGERGPLPDGVWILCPLDIFNGECEEIAGWRLYPSDYAQKVEKLIINAEISDYDTLMKEDNTYLMAYMKKLQIFEKN